MAHGSSPCLLDSLLAMIRDTSPVCLVTNNYAEAEYHWHCHVSRVSALVIFRTRISDVWYLLSAGGDNVDRQLPHTDYYSVTRSLGRQPRAGHVSHVTSGQPDISLHPAFRHLMPRTRGERHVSPINTHYTRIYSGLTESALERVERETVSSDSDYDTIYSNKDDSNTLVPIGNCMYNIV